MFPTSSVGGIMLGRRHTMDGTHRMPMLFLFCGLPGSGKPTLARQIEREQPALYFSEDVWMLRLYDLKDGGEAAKRELVKRVQWETVERALRLGVDVVLDWGFWGRSERDEARAQAAELGVHAELHFLDVPRDELWRRLRARNSALPPDTYHVTEILLDECWNMFQPPTADELEATNTTRRAIP